MTHNLQTVGQPRCGQSVNRRLLPQESCAIRLPVARICVTFSRRNPPGPIPTNPPHETLLSLRIRPGGYVPNPVCGGWPRMGFSMGYLAAGLGGAHMCFGHLGLAFTCDRGDSNPHWFPNRILNPARLPVPPRSRGGWNNNLYRGGGEVLLRVPPARRSAASCRIHRVSYCPVTIYTASGRPRKPPTTGSRMTFHTPTVNEYRSN